jgi:hypothetical protein
MDTPIVDAANGQPDLSKPGIAHVIQNVGRGEVILYDGSDAVQVRRLVWPNHRELKGQDVGVIAEEVHGDGTRAEGCPHQVGFPKPRLHCFRALVSGAQKNVGVTVVYRRRLVDRFHRWRLYL